MVWRLPVWAWAGLGLVGVVSIAIGARRTNDVGTAATTTSRATISPTAFTLLEVGAHAQPDVSASALEFIDADECHVHELRDDVSVAWFQCTREDPSRDGGVTGVVYITEDSDPVAALEYAQALPEGYNENVAVLYWVRGGGIMYFPNNLNWAMFDVGPYPDDIDIVDTDCPPFPEEDPALCPDTPGPQWSDATVTSAGLTETSAWLACVFHGDNAFRYGWDPHTVLGMIAKRIVDDHWFFKFEADVTNQFGAEASTVIECDVSGSDSSPTVDRFFVY